MMKKRVRLVLLSTAVLLSVLFGSAWRREQAPPATVQTGSASVSDIYNSITVSGTIESADSTAVCPGETAVVAQVHAQIGQEVRQGDVLCTLQTAQAYTADVQQAVQLAAAVSAQKCVVQQTMLLVAPQDGVVTDLPDVGQTVWAGLPCLVVADMEQMVVRAQTPESYARQVRVGQKANVTADALGNQLYAAQVQSVSPVAVRAVSLLGEESGATVETLLRIESSTDGLRPGYSANIKIFIDQHQDAVIVPYEAVVQQGEQQCVYCVRQGKAVLQAIETGYLLENAIEVTEGLDGGETIILSPPETLENGDRVEIAE